MVRVLICALVLTTSWSGEADAAVRGGKFTGTINSTLGNSATTTLDFASVGNARAEVQSIGGIPNAYKGTYTEYEFGAFSYWTGTFTGAPTYQASGFSFFGIISTYALTNSGAASATGFVVRSGVGTP